MLKLEDAVSILDNDSEIGYFLSKGYHNKKLMRILSYLLTYEPKNYDHPFVEQLTSWLLDSQRKGEEFAYLVGPVQRHLKDSYRAKYIKRSSFVSKIGLEALAIICPVLEGPREQAAWFLTIESLHHSKKKYGTSSNRLSGWIINMVGNSDFCPNINLRIRLMTLLYQMVDLNDNNQTQAFESLMSVFSPIINYGSSYEGLTISIIKRTFENFEKKGYLKVFDKTLAEQLQRIEVSRVYSIVNDVACNSAFQSHRNTLPKELHNLSDLLETLSGFAEYVNNNEGNDVCSDEQFILITDIICRVIGSMPKSFQSPLLLDKAESCINILMNVIVSPYIDSHLIHVQLSISNLLGLLKDILTEDTFKTKYEFFSEYITVDLTPYREI